MFLALAVVLLLVLAVGALLLARGRKSAQPSAPRAASRAAMGTTATAQSVADALAADDGPEPTGDTLPPPELAAVPWADADSLPEARRQALVAAVQRIPRPPSALQQLLSPQALERASSQALAELIGAEPQLAAKLLATVNSPAYGLRAPVTGIGQAVTFLGLNTVRALCMRTLLDASFAGDNPALARSTTALWNASALASELCSRLAGRLGLADSGTLTAQVLLSFIGHLASARLLALAGQPVPEVGASLPHRCNHVHAHLGLPPSELGALVLKAWGLPAPIVEAVRSIDRQGIAPALPLHAADARRLALAHLCARLGEQLASQPVAADEALAAAGAAPQAAAGLMAGLASELLRTDAGWHLRRQLTPAMVQKVIGHLQAPELLQAVLSLQQAMQPGRGAASGAAASAAHTA